MTKTLEQLSKKMKDIDFAMLATHTRGGTIGARPMSNNREVDYNGDAWFFTDNTTLMNEDIMADPSVTLSYQGSSGLLGQRPFFLAVEGRASLIQDKDEFEVHWTKGIERWWPQGVDTPGLVLIKVSGERAHYWDGEDEGELVLSSASAPVN
ncbi:pyridoxamine 5'-phosphate oxidase family protein [Sphingobium phenoxybenzoativorans]|uniref:Pyridoxamine 5'-phosphate oxidase family protein n=1 Tax=Sphingobium phenoxybenzoativorans TaxID=1592790 RepID=A0A975K5Z3_9SPHN|nr:pyridoxamine 5'-phosphate oxidase family protein [Sphingobium phenoxybenzoativorans]QUT05102.1 pyridoxamine 5'-phosphate oxidase family protein [Sphingobium phenoxybenzoativorans]